MLVVAQADVLLVDAKVAPRDVDQLQVGQKAVLRFTAFNQRTTPELLGKVTLVGADEKTGTAYFKTQITRHRMIWRSSTERSSYRECQSRFSSRQVFDPSFLPDQADDGSDFAGIPGGLMATAPGNAIVCLRPV